MPNYLNINQHAIREHLVFERVYANQQLERTCYEPDEFESALRRFLNSLHDGDLMKVIFYNSDSASLNKVVANNQFPASTIIQTKLDHNDLVLSTKQHRALINVFVFYKRQLFETDFLLNNVF